MSETAETGKQTDDDPQIVDVWCRTASRYRRRAVLMLCLLAVLFAGLCCFTFWLRTGVYWPWDYDGYQDLMARSFRPAGSNQVTLSDFLSSPISVKDIPIHGLIMGLLFASLCSIPLLVAILYRFPFSTLFAAMVVFLAAMPWLGITVFIGCATTALKPFRFSFRYASALVGLIPIAIYFVSASWEPSGSQFKPVEQQALLYAPWVLAVLGSCVICAFALAIARLIGYRPGGIPPVLAMLFAVPVFLFHSQLGRDELVYRILEEEIGPGGSTLFRTVNVGDVAGRSATRRWSETQSESYDEILTQALQKVVDKALLQGEEDRLEAVARCNSFMERFPKSRYIENVLFLKGRAQDQRIQWGELLDDSIAEYHSDVPNQSSRKTWEALAKKFPSSSLTATALYKLAVLQTRDGDLDAAVASLEVLLERFDISLATTQPGEYSAQQRASVFSKTPPAAGLGVDRAILVMQARRLREMLIACRDDAPKPYREVFGPGVDTTLRPVQLLLWLDDTDPQYRTNLEGITRVFPHSETAGYVEIRLALLEPAISRRMQRFQRVAEALAGRPSGAEALFHLAETRQEDSILDETKTAFDQLIQLYPDSCWATEAKERLSSLSMLEAAAKPHA